MLVPTFILLLVVRRKLLFSDRDQVVAFCSVAFVGLIGAGIAVGRGPIVSVPLPFYDVARVLVPGVDSMVAIVRVFIFMQLALVVAAVVAMALVLRSIPRRSVRAIVALGVLALVVVDSKQTVARAEVPLVADGSVYAAMQALDAGKAVELPIPPINDPGRPYLESTRMVLGSDDDLRIVNGHSGHWPIDYERSVEKLNTFPSQSALDELHRIGVRYVVLHSTPVETGMDIVSYVVNGSGYAYYQPADLERVLAELPPDAIARTIVANDGVILELAN